MPITIHQSSFVNISSNNNTWGMVTIRKLTEKDLILISQNSFQGYQVENIRIKQGEFLDSDCYGILLCKSPEGYYVTWQFHLDEDGEPKTYWGHYFMENHEGAIQDFITRDSHNAPSEVNNDYWDCDCEEFYIHPQSTKYCPSCGARREERPDSLQREVDKGLNFYSH